MMDPNAGLVSKVMRSMANQNTTKIMHNVMHYQGHYDRTLLFTVLMLLVIGVVMVYSSSSVVALTTYDDGSYFLKRQILSILIGLALMAIMMRIDYRWLSNQRIVLALVIFSLILLGASLGWVSVN